MSRTTGHVIGKESELGEDENGEDATAVKIGKMERFLDFVRYHIVPPVFLVVFTGSVQLLAIVGRDEPVSWAPMATSALGNIFSWSSVLVFILWAFLSLKVSTGEAVGPITLFNFTPTYKTNGVVYYLATMLLLLLSEMLCPHFCQHIFINIPEILGTLNIISLLFCSYLFIKGKFFAEHVNDKPKALPVLYEFYRGMELHPRLLGVDVKQLTNSRIGVMAWQILVLVFYITSTQRNGFNVPTVVTFFLQMWREAAKGLRHKKLLLPWTFLLVCYILNRVLFNGELGMRKLPACWVPKAVQPHHRQY